MNKLSGGPIESVANIKARHDVIDSLDEMEFESPRAKRFRLLRLLYQHTLEAIAKGTGDPIELAKAALQIE